MRLAFATGCIGLVLGFACSSGSGGSSGGPATSSGAFIQDFCNLLEPCCAQAGLSTAGTLCVAFAQSAATKGGYDPANGQACISGMQAESGSATFCTTLGNDVPACSLVFTASNGTTPGGGPCKQDSDCARSAGGGATCFTNFAFVDGGTSQTETCVQTTVGKAGDSPCVATVEPLGTIYSWSGSGPPPAQGFTCALADGLTCNGTTQQCTALASVGQPCTGDSTCVPSAYCSFGGSTEQCAARLADGASCAGASTGCATTSYCDSASTTCKPQLATGSPCTTAQQCSSGQCINMACSASTSLGLQLLCGSK